MEKAILCFTTGEFYWEFFRFAPYVIWKKEVQYKELNPKLIVLTRPDRFDIYGKYADGLLPLEIKGDNSEHIQNSFRLDNFPIERYKDIADNFKNAFKNRYDILEVICPDVSKAMFSNKRQYDQTKMIFDYKPRNQNMIEIDKYIENKNNIVVIAPRFRCNMKRNWLYWQDFYDMIYNSDLINRFNFIICGKSPDYTPDLKNRFMDINRIAISENISLVGLLIELIRNRSILTVGSQSAIPNISLLFGVEVLEWGHQKYLHTVEYNINNTKITFIEDLEYKILPNVIFQKMSEILEDKVNGVSRLLLRKC